MVVSVDMIRVLKPYGGKFKDALPTMHYTNGDTLTSVLGVRTIIFDTRRRFVRIEREMLYIHTNGDDCGEPLHSVRLDEVEDVIPNNHRATILLQRAKEMRFENSYKMYAEIGEVKVYVAVGKKIGDKFAVMVMPKEHADPKIRQHAKREAEIVRFVNISNMVATHDVFETSDAYEIVMEYVSGGNLVNVLAAHLS